jgi:hypothetical protein
MWYSMVSSLGIPKKCEGLVFGWNGTGMTWEIGYTTMGTIQWVKLIYKNLLDPPTFGTSGQHYRNDWTFIASDVRMMHAPYIPTTIPTTITTNSK